MISPQRSHLSEESGMEIFLKKDYMQYTGSFKERGARYSLIQLDPKQKKKGVISASAGNHAQAMAYHGGQLGELGLQGKRFHEVFYTLTSQQAFL